MATRQMIVSTNQHNIQHTTEVNIWGDGDDGNNVEEVMAMKHHQERRSPWPQGQQQGRGRLHCG
jgi:hypothetical protein